ncbi:MAG: class I SAM-dependent DNA methyltransferase [Chthonomonadales bacterium]
MSRFDKAAATWDVNPARVEQARNIAAAIRQHVGGRRGLIVVDYGCGTGLVTLELQDLAAEITGMDSSLAMLAELERKARIQGLRHVRTLHGDLQSDPPPPIGADLVVSAMTLHHVEDVPSVLSKLVTMLKPGGLICLADLDREDGSFHQDNTGVHHFGFDRQEIAEWLSRLGLINVFTTTAHTVERPTAGGTRTFTVFLVGGWTSGSDIAVLPASGSSAANG